MREEIKGNTVRTEEVKRDSFGWDAGAAIVIMIVVVVVASHRHPIPFTSYRQREIVSGERHQAIIVTDKQVAQIPP